MVKPWTEPGESTYPRKNLSYDETFKLMRHLYQSKKALHTPRSDEYSTLTPAEDKLFKLLEPLEGKQAERWINLAKLHTPRKLYMLIHYFHDETLNEEKLNIIEQFEESEVSKIATGFKRGYTVDESLSLTNAITCSLPAKVARMLLSKGYAQRVISQLAYLSVPAPSDDNSDDWVHLAEIMKLGLGFSTGRALPRFMENLELADLKEAEHYSKTLPKDTVKRAQRGDLKATEIQELRLLKRHQEGSNPRNVIITELEKANYAGSIAPDRLAENILKEIEKFFII